MQPSNLPGMQQPAAPAPYPQLAPVPGVTQLPGGDVVVKPSVVEKDVAQIVDSVKKHYASPAFWYHASLQILIWLSYFQSANTDIKLGSLTASVGGFIAYLIHLVKA